MKHFKLWGPLRSGTNYLGRVMELNFEDVVIHHNEGGWKHGPPQHTFYKEQTMTGLHRRYDGHLLVVKSPFAWIDSMRRYEMYSERPDIIMLAERWNNHARELFTFSWNEDAKLIRYERLIRFFAIEMGEITRLFDLDLPKQYTDEKRKMLRGGDYMKGDQAVSNTPRDLSYYLEHQYMENFFPEEIETIREQIDEYLVRQLNYQDEYFQQIF